MDITIPRKVIDLWNGLWPILAVVGVVVGVITAVVRAEPHQVAAEASLVRVALQNANASESEDVLGQAVEINRNVARNQALNDMPIMQWFIPNTWDAIEILQMPVREP